MSAIAGLWRFDGRPDRASDCDRMLDAQRMYGPHDSRVWDGERLAMGRRLFRTVPEDAHDHKPLHSRDGRLTLVADIRLDNRDDLAATLDLTHATAATLCDAAMLLASLERWGEKALDRVVGDFAFALFDATTETLTLARDYSGQRPLHYHAGSGFFAFASMPKGLHALHEIPRAPDESAIAEWVALIPENAPRSYFAGIERVLPAHIVTVTRTGVSRRCYWEPPRPAQTHNTPDDYVEGVRYHLDRATKAQLRGANGRIGTHLSGGLDSSAVTATAARLLASDGGKVFAFTSVPRHGYAAQNPSPVDEEPLAAETAALYANVEHVIIRSGHVSPLAGLDRMFLLYDQPIVNPVNWVWMAAIHDAARARNLGVLLTGQLGNLTFSYNGSELLPELLRAGRLLKFRQVAASRIAQSGLTWRRALTNSASPFLPAGLWRWAARLTGRYRNVLDRTVLRAERAAAFDLDAIARERNFDFTNRRWQDGFAVRRSAILSRDPGNYNKGYLAGWGIDRRDPTADRRLAEYCLAVPTEEYLRDGIPRALARKALADRLPPSVVAERRTALQAPDWHEGLTAARDEVASEVERLAGLPSADRILDIARMRHLVEHWPVSGWEQRETMQQYRMALLRGIAAGHFLRKSSGANA